MMKYFLCFYRATLC